MTALVMIVIILLMLIALALVTLCIISQLDRIKALIDLQSRQIKALQAKTEADKEQIIAAQNDAAVAKMTAQSASRNVNELIRRLEARWK